ncbi:hypothetical protein ACFQ3N_19400 [Virgibacillus byunsanensis]|uniref:Uncharacterized protein n=1 Tax=Virgibacillus byunsanensis TaxID=570945 RepID=A0ABW3LQA2_9BACI
MIPDGVALFGDIEPSFPVDSAFIRAGMIPCLIRFMNQHCLDIKQDKFLLFSITESHQSQ